MMRYKRHTRAAAVMTAFLLLGGVAACANDDGAHTHEYGEWIDEVRATCTEGGTLGHYSCDGCGKNFDARARAHVRQHAYIRRRHGALLRRVVRAYRPKKGFRAARARTVGRRQNACLRMRILGSRRGAIARQARGVKVREFYFRLRRGGKCDGVRARFRREGGR